MTDQQRTSRSSSRASPSPQAGHGPYRTPPGPATNARSAAGRVRPSRATAVRNGRDRPGMHSPGLPAQSWHQGGGARDVLAAAGYGQPGHQATTPPHTTGSDQGVDHK
jgi:hypothetical protein